MPTQLTEIARARGLVIFVDVDAASTLADSVDDQLISLLRGLQATRVRVVLVSARSREALDPLRNRIPGAWWAADRGAWCINDRGWSERPVIEWVREQSQDPVLLALADVRGDDVVTVDGCDVRDLLGWIATVRAGG